MQHLDNWVKDSVRLYESMECLCQHKKTVICLFGITPHALYCFPHKGNQKGSKRLDD